MMLRTVVGEEFRRTRENKNKTLKSVANQASISLGYLSEIERGLKEPSSEIIQAVCRSLDVTLSDFLLGVVFEVARQEHESDLTSIMQ